MKIERTLSESMARTRDRAAGVVGRHKGTGRASRLSFASLRRIDATGGSN